MELKAEAIAISDSAVTRRVLYGEWELAHWTYHKFAKRLILSPEFELCKRD